MTRTLAIAMAQGVIWAISAEALADDDDAPAAAPAPEEGAASDETAASPPGDDAMVQFQQGKEFYNQGEFEKAAIALKRAYELRPGYRILYYLGWAENEVGNYTRALEAFNGFLAEAGAEEEEEKLAEVQKEVARLRARVGHLSIRCPDRFRWMWVGTRSW